MRTDFGIEAIAKALLVGERGAVETCSLLIRRSGTEELLQREDFDFLRAVESETDALPVGKYKANWHPDFVQAKLNPLARYEKSITEEAMAICGRILQAMELRRMKDTQ